MANYYADARSNYFRVKDEQAFRDALAPYEVEIVKRNAVEYALLANGGDCNGWPSWSVNEQDEDVEIDFPALVAEHLADGEVAIFMEAGAEKLRYIVGQAIAINANGETRVVDLTDIYNLAAELGSRITPARY